MKKQQLLLIFLLGAVGNAFGQFFPDSTTCISNTFNLSIDSKSSSITACGPVKLKASFTGSPVIYWSNNVIGSESVIYESGYVWAFAKDSAGCFDTTQQVYVDIQSSKPWAYSNTFYTSFCSGQSLKLSAYAGNPGQWNTGDKTAEITVTKGGKYYYVATSSAGCKDTSNVLDITEVTVQKPKITVKGNKVICKQDTTMLETSSSNNISWYPYGFGNSIRATYSGINYAIATESTLGCTANSDTVIITIYEPFTETLCMVTNDSFSGYNMLMWNKTPGKRTEKYRIYREGNVAGGYNLIGTVNYSANPRFLDSNSVPRQRAYSYYIEAVDSCGNSTEESRYYAHTTVHLTASLGVSGENNLNWTDYLGIYPVTGYAIYRENNGGSFVEIDKVASTKTSYSDLNPPQGTNRYYIAVIADVNCSSVKGTVRFRSNQVQFGTLNTRSAASSVFRIFPNPAADQINVESTLATDAEIKDATGRTALSVKLNKGTNNINTASLPSGVYWLKSNNKASKFIISR